MAKGRDAMADRLAERLAPLGIVRARAMFGGHGIYRGDRMFAVVHRDRLYLKADDASAPGFDARDLGPFRPDDRRTMRSFREAPAEALDDDEALLSWAREAIRAAESAR